MQLSPLAACEEDDMVYGPPGGFARNKPAVHIDREYCTGCMRCVHLCPLQIVLAPKRDERGTYAHAKDPQACAGCGLCLHNCPTHAVRISMTLRNPER